MLKRDFFMLALKNEKVKKTNWVIRAFALTRDTNTWDQDTELLEVIQTGDKYSFVTMSDSGEKILEVIEDSNTKFPLFSSIERLNVRKGEIPNIDEDMEVTYGQMLYNYIILVIPFNDKIPYKNIRKVESIIAERMVDDSAPDDVKAANITIANYLLFTECVLSLDNYSQLFTPAATRKSMVPPPWVKEYRAELIEQYKDTLHDPATVALIDKALVTRYREYMKDDPSMNFMISGKAIDLSAKKRFLMYGAEPGIDGAVSMDPIIESLSEGWNIDRLPAYINAQRAGSHNRGFQTRLGGEEFKWAVRSTINLLVAADDCGSTIGIPYSFTEQNIDQMVGCYAIGSKGLIHITNENKSEFIGKRVNLRSPMTCKLKGNNRCAKCCGDKLAMNKTGLSSAITAANSGVMYIFMAAAHAKGVRVAKLTDDAFI